MLLDLLGISSGVVMVAGSLGFEGFAGYPLSFFRFGLGAAHENTLLPQVKQEEFKGLPKTSTMPAEGMTCKPTSEGFTCTDA